MIDNTVLTSEDMQLVDQPNARSEIFGVHQEDWLTTPWSVVSAGYNYATSIRNNSRTCEKGTYVSQDNQSHPAKLTNIKETRACVSMNM